MKIRQSSLTSPPHRHRPKFGSCGCFAVIPISFTPNTTGRYSDRRRKAFSPSHYKAVFIRIATFSNSNSLQSPNLCKATLVLIFNFKIVFMVSVHWLSLPNGRYGSISDMAFRSLFWRVAISFLVVAFPHSPATPTRRDIYTPLLFPVPRLLWPCRAPALQ